MVDATVVADLLLHTRDVELQQRFMKQRLAAPHLVDAEVAQVLRRYVQLGVLSASYGRQALADLAALRIVRHDHRWLLPAVWPLRDQMTAYDALYVALAEALEAPLWTRDDRLARAAGHLVPVECP